MHVCTQYMFLFRILKTCTKTKSNADVQTGSQNLSPLNQCVVACIKLRPCSQLSDLQASLSPRANQFSSLGHIHIHVDTWQQSWSIISILLPPSSYLLINFTFLVPIAFFISWSSIHIVWTIYTQLADYYPDKTNVV